MTDGDASHSEFTFTEFVLAVSFPACIMYWFHWFCYNTTEWGSFHTGGHRASRILYNDASQSFMLTPVSD